MPTPAITAVCQNIPNLAVIHEISIVQGKKGKNMAYIWAGFAAASAVFCLGIPVIP